MSTKEYDYSFKILLMGEDAEGKPLFISRFVYDTNFKNHLSTIGLDFKIKKINYANKSIKLQIWDTSSKGNYKNITTSYLKGADGVIIMFDVTDQNSFKNIRTWIENIELNPNKSLKKVLVGNNCDELNRVIFEEEGKKMADEFNIRFFESSVKTGKNIKEIFYYLVEEILKEKGVFKEEEKVIKKEKIKLLLSKNKGKNKKNGCAK